MLKPEEDATLAARLASIDPWVQPHNPTYKARCFFCKAARRGGDGLTAHDDGCVWRDAVAAVTGS